MKRYLVVIEKGMNNYSAYSPDVLGCVTVGETVEETKVNMTEALGGHLSLMLEDGEALPEPKNYASYLQAVQDSKGADWYLCEIEIDEHHLQNKRVAA